MRGGAGTAPGPDSSAGPSPCRSGPSKPAPLRPAPVKPLRLSVRPLPTDGKSEPSEAGGGKPPGGTRSAGGVVSPAGEVRLGGNSAGGAAGSPLPRRGLVRRRCTSPSSVSPSTTALGAGPPIGWPGSATGSLGTATGLPGSATGPAGAAYGLPGRPRLCRLSGRVGSVFSTLAPVAGPNSSGPGVAVPLIVTGRPGTVIERSSSVPCHCSEASEPRAGSSVPVPTSGLSQELSGGVVPAGSAAWPWPCVTSSPGTSTIAVTPP